MVSGLGFGVLGLGFRVQGLGFRKTGFRRVQVGLDGDGFGVSCRWVPGDQPPRTPIPAAYARESHRGSGFRV